METLPKDWYSYALGALVSFFLWVLRGQYVKLDKIGTDYVTREDLEKAMDKRDAMLAKMHDQNLNNFREIRLQNESQNNKLFEIASNQK